MANLQIRKLSGYPIGTLIEINYEKSTNELENIEGYIVDSDFSENFEIQVCSSQRIMINFGLVKSSSVINDLSQIVKTLAIGTEIDFSYGKPENRTPDSHGTIVDNDFEQNIEVQMKSGEKTIIDYSIIRSLIVTSPCEKESISAPKPVQIVASEPVSEPTYSYKKPEISFNFSDQMIKDAYDAIPYIERNKFSSIYESFRQACRMNNKNQMTQATLKALYTLKEDDSRSGQAARFCGCILRRIDGLNYTLFSYGRYYSEASKSCYCKGMLMLAGVYALLALINGETDDEDDLMHILTYSMISTDDASGLSRLFEKTAGRLAAEKKKLLIAGLRSRGANFNENESAESMLNKLIPLYHLSEMQNEIIKREGRPREEITFDEEIPLDSVPAPASSPAPSPARRSIETGMICRLSQCDRVGEISVGAYDIYRFDYDDISDSILKKAVEGCTISNPSGIAYSVTFVPTGTYAKEISLASSYIDLERAVASDNTREDSSEIAFEICSYAFIDDDKARAVTDIIKLAIRLFNINQEARYVETALELYEKHQKYYAARDPFALIDVARCYSYIGKYEKMTSIGETALSIPGKTATQRIPLLSNYLTMLKGYYEQKKDKSILERIIKYIDELKRDYSNNIKYDSTVQNAYKAQLLSLRIYAECHLDMLTEAEIDFAEIPEKSNQKQMLNDLIDTVRRKLYPENSNDEQEAADQYLITEEDETEDSEETALYRDNDGWAALGLTKEDVINYAMSITGEARLPGMLAYLRAASNLNPDIYPVYKIVSLAVDDPIEPHDYSMGTIIDAMSSCDHDYALFNDYCITAAFLRSGFTVNHSDDYGSRFYWQSFGTPRIIEGLDEVYSAIVKFQEQTECPIGIYADLKANGNDSIQAAFDEVLAHADQLYSQHALSPYSNKFYPLVKTKQIIFGSESELSTLLYLVKTNNAEALDNQKKGFAQKYLGGSNKISAEFINDDAIQGLIDDTFEKALQIIQGTKKTQKGQKLQGRRRTYLVSVIYDVIETICNWYELSMEKSEIGLRTPANDEKFEIAQAELSVRLDELSATIDYRICAVEDMQSSAGLFVLGYTLHGLSDWLSGQNRIRTRKYMYVDFLKGNYITLDDSYLPEMESTYCILPEFNILKRIRLHIEGPKLSFQEQIDRIFSAEKINNNYGTAKLIYDYLRDTDSADTISLPMNYEEYVSQSEQQMDMRYHGFCEEYVLAMSYGRIMRSDDFCYNLQDTIGYWFYRAKDNRNYGFFTSLVQQAENMIHNSAQNYQDQLYVELEVIKENNPGCFADTPDYEEAIRTQIANQRFTVAEDWMTRIRMGDFSFNIERQKALEYLDGFLNNYARIYRTVQDKGVSLSSLVAFGNTRNKDTKGGQRIIDNWLTNGGPTGVDKVSALLKLLGWKNISVAKIERADGIELFEVSKDNGVQRLTEIQHPISAFGSDFYNNGNGRLFVACLYGNYDCQRVCARLQVLDKIKGNKFILIDAALGQSDRRALARRLKRSENGFGNLYVIIDRVLIKYLADNYREDQINSMLMATSIPFSYAQPYVPDSAKPMPPEIFIGRKTELQSIKDPVAGVNLIYGGRQLGKSALLKKALSDIDGCEQQRAVLVDINGKNCAESALKISARLIDLGITPDADATDNWDELCRIIANRLRSQEQPRISYLLLLIDEADDFIRDCGNYDYGPMVALKEVQTMFNGQFKYVLAGLHDIVRFNRSVALGNNSVILHMSSLKITPFNTPEAEELLLKPLSYLGFSLSDKVTISQILSTCNYFPGLIQLYAANLIRSVRAADYAGYNENQVPPYAITDTHLKKVLADHDFMDEILRKYEATLLLDKHYYKIALLLACMYDLEYNPNGYTSGEMLKFIRDFKVPILSSLNEETIEAILAELKDLNILRNATNNAYLFASKNFRDLLGTSDDVYRNLMKED